MELRCRKICGPHIISALGRPSQPWSANFHSLKTTHYQLLSS